MTTPLTLGRKVEDVVEGLSFLKDVLYWLSIEYITSPRKREFLYRLICTGALKKKGKILQASICPELWEYMIVSVRISLHIW